MKRSTKAWIKIAGVMTAAGIAFLMAGCAMGGYDTLRNWVKNGDLSWNFGDFGFFGWGSGNSVRFDSRFPVYEGDVERTKIEDAQQIRRLCFDAGGGLIEIKISEDGGYWFSGDHAKEFQCYVDNGCLELRAKGGSWVNNHNYDHVITVWVPAEESYGGIDLDIGGGVLRAERLSGDEISVDVGAGSVETDELNGTNIELDLGAGEILVHRADAERISIDIGAGKVRIDAFSVQKLNAALGAGEAVLTEGEVQDADLSVGMGQIDYSGSVTGDLKAECSMGQIDLELNGKPEDHNYVVECSMGEIRVDTRKYGGMASSQTISNGADSDFELECSMGGIIVTFVP